jgi:ammonium transporter Rh
MSRKRDISRSEANEGSTYVSDIFAMIGTILLWIYWPSFNAVLASGDAFHRAVINTYLSLLGSTVATFIVTGLFGE